MKLQFTVQSALDYCRSVNSAVNEARDGRHPLTKSTCMGMLDGILNSYDDLRHDIVNDDIRYMALSMCKYTYSRVMDYFHYHFKEDMYDELHD